MKKLIILLLTSFLFFLPLKASHSTVKITFKDGTVRTYMANEYWTYFNKYEDYRSYNEYLNYSGKGNENPICTGWICIADYSFNYKEDYEYDYKCLYKYFQEKCNLAAEEDIHYETHHDGMSLAGGNYWWYCVSFRRDAIKSIEVKD